MCQRKFSWKTSKLRTLKKMGENAKEKARKGRATESKSHGSWGVTFRGRCRDSSSPANSPHHRIISHNHIASQPHHISSHHIKQQPITSHIATTSHHIPSHHIDITWQSHHITSSHLTSPCDQPHDIIQLRITTHHITTKKRNQPTTKTPPDGTAQGCCALKNSVWLVALRAFYRQFLCL